MARLARLAHKDQARAVSARLKQFFVLVLSAIIGILISVSVNAQQTKRHRTPATLYKTSNPCAVLEKKRTQKPVKRNTRHTLKKKRQALAETPNFTASLLSPMPAASTVQQYIIREMVATYLKEQRNSLPIELAPLQFYPVGDQLKVQDINPFLIATEFGLQGKTVQISHTTGSDQNNLAQDLLQLMHEMGVPAERISIAETREHANAGLSPGTIRKVSFQVL
jgi:hypothetical protein